MNLFSGLMGKVVIGLVGLLAIIMGAFYWYYTSAEAEIDTLKGNLIKTEIALDAEKLRVARLKSDIEGVKEANANVIESERKARASLIETQRRLDATLDLLKRDPPAAAVKINKEVKFRMECLAIATGATVPDVVKRVPGEINTVCPQFFGALP